MRRDTFPAHPGAHRSDLETGSRKVRAMFRIVEKHMLYGVSYVRDSEGDPLEYETREQAQTVCDMFNRAESIGGAQSVYSVREVKQ